MDALVARLRAAGCVYAEEEAALLAGAAATPGELKLLTDRRIAGEPLEHVLGRAEFCGLRIAVGPGVFVPRPRSAFLVGLAAAAVPRPGAVVVDLCCGSGALGAAVAAAAGPVRLHAADVDPAAVAYARRNIAPYGGVAYEGDLFAALPGALRGRVEVLVANVPYVPSAHVALMPAEAREHEPRVALDGGPDGLDVLRRVAAAAPGWLAPGGRLLVEGSAAQADAAAGVLRAAGLAPSVHHSDDLDATVVIGIRS